MGNQASRCWIFRTKGEHADLFRQILRVRNRLFNNAGPRSNQGSLSSFVFHCAGWATELFRASALPPIPWLGDSRSSKTSCIVGLNMSGQSRGFQRPQNAVLTACQYVLGNDENRVGSRRCRFQCRWCKCQMPVASTHELELSRFVFHVLVYQDTSPHGSWRIWKLIPVEVHGWILALVKSA